MQYKRFILFLMFDVLAILVNAQTMKSYSAPEIRFSVIDTLDIYAGDSVNVTNYVNYESGNPDFWDIQYYGDVLNVLHHDTENFTFYHCDSTILEQETYAINLRVVNYASLRPDTVYLADTTKTFIVRVFPRPYAHLVIRLCDDVKDNVGYSSSSIVTQENDTIERKMLATYATHVIRISVPTLSGNKAYWSWYVNGELQDNSTPYLYQFSDDEASADGMPHEYVIRIVNKLPYNDTPFETLIDATCTVYPYPHAGVTGPYIETYSGQHTGYKFYHSGGIKDKWEVQWTDENGYEMTDEEIGDLCFVTDTLQEHDYLVYVRNGSSDIGYYYGYADLKLFVWPEPSARLSVDTSCGNMAQYDASANTYTLECTEGDTILFHCHTDGGYQYGGQSWVCEIDSTLGYVTDYAYAVFSCPAVYDAASGGEHTYTVRLANVYNGPYMSMDSVWYDTAFTVRVVVDPLVRDVDNTFSITDANQNRSLTDGTLSVRKGNRLVVTSMSDEVYSGKFNYHNMWDINGYDYEDNDSAWSMTADMKQDMADKCRETLSLGRTVYLYDSSGKVITQSAALSYDICIYNRPHTPTQLLRKGNGSSGTVVALSDVSDADLSLYDYYLVFGYVTKDGKLVEKASQVQGGVGTTRFDSRFTSSELLNPDNRFFVYAQWCYDDGVTVTSGRCYMDGTDESWDGSDYSGNGGTIGLSRMRDVDVTADSATAISGVQSSSCATITAGRAYSVSGVSAAGGHGVKIVGGKKVLR